MSNEERTELKTCFAPLQRSTCRKITVKNTKTLSSERQKAMKKGRGE